MLGGINNFTIVSPMQLRELLEKELENMWETWQDQQAYCKQLNNVYHIPFLKPVMFKVLKSA